MALNRQLWIAIASVMIVAFISSIFISFQSAQGYFKEQLRYKNTDNASILALSLSRIEKDPVLIDLMLAAQFDTGHYQRLELVGPDNESIAVRERDERRTREVPEWFADLAGLEVKPGVAQVSDGWQQYGTLYVESLGGFALEALWETTVELFFGFLAMAILLGLAGSLVLKRLTRPLVDVVRQAEALGNQRFVTTNEPNTLEFRRVVHAMNQLTGHVQGMLNDARGRVEAMRDRLQQDAVTGVGNRNRFDDVIAGLLSDSDRNARHAIFLLRLTNLEEINRVLGRQETDRLIRTVAGDLAAIAGRYQMQFNSREVLRLNGSDFALVLADALDARSIASELNEAMRDRSEHYKDDVAVKTVLSATYFGVDASRSTILTALDDGLARAEHRDGIFLEWVDDSDHAQLLYTSDEWRRILSNAIAERTFSSVYFPVQSLNGGLIHKEVMLRLDVKDKTLTAGQFLPWVRRFGLLPQLDLAVLEHEVSEVTGVSDAGCIAVNLSIETLLDETTRRQLIDLLATGQGQGIALSVEVPERSVLAYPVLFRDFCESVVPMGHNVGIEKAGQRLSDVDDLQALGLSYIKLDRSLTAGLADSADKQNYLRGVTGITRAVGLTVIAEGVQSHDEFDRLVDLGVDGAIGPGID
ncbi:EAL domain-containing protein [Spiribacter vilamensis]|uniref:Diguanylate cyclase/phosphodiesterase n=1 Tax=Spiribacter vilamensis TaxID=531306 RepID=A0A4Q8D0N6_9GAMM|nr:EAL domain-containing protein [Spiribacter vilamensis]RZU98911.1 diguanylate cyclase/phosphodiesterase [Spiribacter vilamensis]TVO62077.1 EAL domain-containing protein [Spiribacter vilamensis]